MPVNPRPDDKTRGSAPGPSSATVNAMVPGDSVIVIVTVTPAPACLMQFCRLSTQQK